jgi:hypothetical protein
MPLRELRAQGSVRLNVVYYISKQIIPAMERVLSLVGADVRSWYSCMPKTLRMQPQKRPAAARPAPSAGAAISAAGAAAAAGLHGCVPVGVLRLILQEVKGRDALCAQLHARGPAPAAAEARSCGAAELCRRAAPAGPLAGRWV